MNENNNIIINEIISLKNIYITIFLKASENK